MEVISAAENWLDGQYSDFFFEWLANLEQRAKKCIEVRGEYVEQILSLFTVACFFPGRAKDLSAPSLMYPHLRPSGESLTSYVAFLWVEVGHACIKP